MSEEIVPIDQPSTALATNAPEVPEEWGISTPKRIAQLKSARANVGNVKHGLLSTIPMICRDNSCPVKQHCVYQQRGEVTAGERCILEIGKLTEGHDRYLQEFKVDALDPEQRVDNVQIQQLLSMEIIIGRCEMLLSSGNLIEEVEVAMNPQGDVITQPMLHKAAELLPKLQRRHSEILQQLVATRKDKITVANVTGINIADFTKQLLERAQQVAARQQLMRDGKLEEADKLGIAYGIAQHLELEGETIDHPPE